MDPTFLVKNVLSREIFGQRVMAHILVHRNTQLRQSIHHRHVLQGLNLSMVIRDVFLAQSTTTTPVTVFAVLAVHLVVTAPGMVLTVAQMLNQTSAHQVVVKKMGPIQVALRVSQTLLTMAQD